MIEQIITWCAHKRGLVFGCATALAAFGTWCMLHTPLDALPDISDVQIVISTEWPGRSPDAVEDHVTYPLVTALVSTPRVKTVRGLTEFGVSHVYVVFEDGTDLYWARTRVLEYLESVRSTMPDGVTPTMAPDGGSVGWVFEYALVDRSGSRTLDELRSLQDWTLRYGLKSVRGVADVASIGGFVKQYQVQLDPNRLLAYNLSPRHVVDAIRASNGEAEGRLLELAGREYMVRARGNLQSVEDIEGVAIATDRGAAPVRVGDVARVSIGPDIRRGIAELNGEGEVVGGIVVMRIDENALQVIERVKERLGEIQHTLPAGVSIVPVYDRSELIGSAIATLRRILIEEMLAVAVVVGAFLFHFKSAGIVLLALPVGVLVSFVPIWYSGLTSNVMSLGGIALAIGVLVDAAIVIVENGYRKVVETAAPASERVTAVVDAARQVGRPVFYSLAIMVVSFAPVLLLEAEEGRLFRPLALTKTFAMIGATLLAITVVPALMVAWLKGEPAARARANVVTNWCSSLYEPLLRAALRRKTASLIANGAFVLLVLPLIFVIGREFMPQLYEGSLLYMPTAPPGLSITGVTRAVQTQDRVLMQFPEVDRVFGTAGGATTASDNSPLNMVNTTITLKPRAQWRRAMTMERLQTEMDRALQFAGFPNVWTQPIRSRVDMLSTGLRTPIGVKVLGAEVAVVQHLGEQIERTLKDLPGTRSAFAERSGDGFFLDIRVDRAAISRYGLTAEVVQDVVHTAIGGSNVDRILEGRERYPINIRYQRDFRDDIPGLERVLVRAADGQQVPLGRIATIAPSTGPAMIRNENGFLAEYVYVDTEQADLAAYVARARDAVSRHVRLPPGYSIEWSGQFESMARASRRLRLIVPIVLVAIFVLLYAAFGSVGEALMIMASVVFAMTGGLILQWLLGYRFSVAVWIGYIALFGVAVQTGVVMVIYLQEALEQKMRNAGLVTREDLFEATVAGAVLRLRPKLMTVGTTVLGLLPIMWATGAGSDVMKPIATPILGGMLTSAVHVLLITPLLFYLTKSRALARASLSVP